MFDGTRVGKGDERIICLASIDELNSQLGLAGAFEDIQRDLFELGAIVANPKSTGNMAEHLIKLENRAIKLEAGIPALKNFILPAGDNTACQIHLARAVCRRAETQIVKISGLNENCLAYLNRLSDYLFLRAREQNLKSGKKEEIWKKM